MPQLCSADISNHTKVCDGGEISDELQISEISPANIGLKWRSCWHQTLSEGPKTAARIVLKVLQLLGSLLLWEREVLSWLDKHEQDGTTQGYLNTHQHSRHGHKHKAVGFSM